MFLICGTLLYNQRLLPASGSTSLHQNVTVNGRPCLGGASALVLKKLFAKIPKTFDQSLLQSIPQPLRDFDITNADDYIEHLRLVAKQS